MLSELLAQKLASGDTAGAEALKGIALAAWGHMNLHGRFEFTTRPHPVDMAALVQQLAQHMDGVLARLAAERARTVLVCATRGEAGEIHNPDLDPEEAKERLGAIREEELRRAGRGPQDHGAALLGTGFAFRYPSLSRGHARDARRACHAPGAASSVAQAPRAAHA